MFSPTRTVLYLAIGIMSFAANEAAAITCAAGKTTSCVTNSGCKTCWCVGSEVCDVTANTLDPDYIADITIPANFVRCTVHGSDTSIDGAEGADGSFGSCPRNDFSLPTGTLTCDGGTNPSQGPTAPTGAPYDTFDCQIYGLNGVEINGQSVVGPADRFRNDTVCSNKDVQLTGKAIVYGDAVAGGKVKANGGATVVGTTYNQAILAGQTNPGTPARCGPPIGAYSSGAGITFNQGGSYNPSTGVLKVSGGGTVALDPLVGNPYCFKEVKLNGGSILQISGPTTINMDGPFQMNGSAVFIKQSDTQPNAELFINSSSSAAVEFDGGSGFHVNVFAPSADIKFTAGANFAGSFLGKTVKASGHSTLNNDSPAVIFDANDVPLDELFATAPFTCNTNGICTAAAEVVPPPGSTCDSALGPLALAFTADAFVGTVEICDGDPSLVTTTCRTAGQQLCQLVNGNYVCADVTQACGD